MLPKPDPKEGKVQAVEIVENSAHIPVADYAQFGYDRVQYLVEVGRRDLAEYIAQNFARQLNPKILINDRDAIDISELSPEEVQERIDSWVLEPDERIEVRHSAMLVQPKLLPAQRDPRAIAQRLISTVEEESEARVHWAVRERLESRLTELIARLMGFEVHVKNNGPNEEASE